jgi:hypothetical protein
LQQITKEKLDDREVAVLMSNFPNEVIFLSNLEFTYPASHAITLVSKIKNFVKSSTRIKIKSDTG